MRSIEPATTVQEVHVADRDEGARALEAVIATPAGADNRHAQTILDSIPIALLVFDRTLRIVTRNRAAGPIFGDAEDAAVLLDHLGVDGVARDWRRELADVLDTRQPRQIDALVAPGADQREMYLSLTCAPLIDPHDGSVNGGLILAEDVSARISMERRLAISERMAAVGNLAARVAHELNNPLDGIMRYTNLAKRVADGNGNGNAKLVEYLEKAAAGLARMAEITTTLLEFSRTTHNRFDHATINTIVEDSVSALNGRARENHVSVVCHLHQEDMPVVRSSSLFQVFCNLVKNAIDAMPDGGTLTIATKLDGPNVVVSFADTGSGLPPQADRIFEAFFTTKPPGKGTGLGLAVCRELVERYSGTITAANRPEGGAILTVSVPRRNCAAVPVERRSRLEPESGAGASGDRDQET